MERRWLRIAHRGASGTAPEHTRPAFERALELGVDMIELDVQLSRDHQLVVIHDGELERTTSGRGPVRERDWAELKTLDAGSWFGSAFAGQPILRLQEVIELVGDRARLNIEMKAPAADWPALAASLTGLLRANGLLASAVVSCFDPHALAAVRARSVELSLGLLWQQANLSDAWPWARRLRLKSIHPHWALTSTDLIQTARLEGLQVLTWTVNEVETMRHLVQQDVDGIMSDFPERFADVDASALPATEP